MRLGATESQVHAPLVAPLRSHSGNVLLAYLLNDLLLQEAPLLIVALAWMGAIAWPGAEWRALHVPLQQSILRELVLLKRSGRLRPCT